MISTTKRKFSGAADASESSEDGSTSKKLKPLSGKVKKGSFEHRFERRRYLVQLVQEFQTTQSMECKQQILANLANFAYDSYNYHYFQEIGVIPIFLAELSVNRDPKLTEYAMAGLCNCAPDNRIRGEILRSGGLPLIKMQVYSSSVETTLSALTTMVYLMYGNAEVKQDFSQDMNFLDQVSHLNYTSHDRRVKNVANGFIMGLQ